MSGKPSSSLPAGLARFFPPRPNGHECGCLCEVCKEDRMRILGEARARVVLGRPAATLGEVLYEALARSSGAPAFGRGGSSRGEG